MKAIILAGGEGRRLRPLTDKLPKPMVPVMNRPLMAYQLDLLKRHGITSIAVALGYRGESIEAYFQDGSDYGVQLTYYRESEPRGTAGCLKAAADFITEDCVVLSGDAVTDVNLTSALYYHREKQGLTTMILKEQNNPPDYNVVLTDADGKIRLLSDRPDWDEVRSNTVNTGMYIIKPEILSHIPDRGAYDLAGNLFPDLLARDFPLYGYVMSNYWCDISDVSAYRRCHQDIFKGRVQLGITEDVLNRGVLIGRDCRIADTAVIERYTVIGDGSTVADGARLRDCILWSGSQIPENADLYRTVACGSQMVYAAPAARAYADTLPEGTHNHFCGTVNDDITPEFILRLSLAYANALRPDAKILLSLPDESQYMMLKFAFLSGIMSGGAVCYNLVGAGDRSVAKFALRKLALDGGIHVQLEGQRIWIELLRADGTPADKSLIRGVKDSLSAGTLSHADPARLHAPVNVNDIPLYYFKDLVATTPCKRLNFSVGVCTDSTALKNHMKKISSAFGMSVLFTNDRALLPDLIKENKLNFGLLDDSNGKYALYDEHGKVLSGDMFYGLVSLMVLSAVEGAELPMPQHVSDTVTTIAKNCGGSISRVPDYGLEQRLLASASPASRLQHELCFDPIRCTVRLCEFLFLNRCTLSHVCSLLPVMHKINRKVLCPPTKKGYVMRNILSALEGGKAVDLTEGMKFIDDRGWVLIMPDYSHSRIHIVSESQDEEYACELAGEVCKRIESLTRD